MRVIVSGAQGGLGTAIVKQLVDAGCLVAACDKYAPAKQLPGSLPIVFDMADWDDIGVGVNKAIERMGGCDAVVANAGIVDTVHRSSRFEQSDWRKDVDVNLTGSFRLVQAAMPALLESRSGRVVFVSSIAAILGQPGQAAYAASKSGLIGLARTLAVELGASGVTCNVVMPGLVDTPKVLRLPKHIRERYTAKIPLNRFGTPTEIAGTISFLLSPAAAYINGAIIRIDGGLGLNDIALASGSRSDSPPAI